MRKIKADEGRLVSEVNGEVEKADDGVLVIKRIHVTHTLKSPESERQTAERVHVELLSALWLEQFPCIFTATPIEYERCLHRRPPLEAAVQPVVLRPATVAMRPAGEALRTRPLPLSPM